MHSFLEFFQSLVIKKQLKPDMKQQKAVACLNQVANKVIASRKRWFGRNQVSGVYLYGPVGTGKTLLIDAFYEYLPIKKKVRWHFYEFMKMIQSELKKLEGEKNPITILAKQMAKKTYVICFDEFFVTNIVDAMLLGGLLQALFDEKITLVMTSNCYPDDLYPDGLQRERFIPAIELIKKHSTVLSVNNGADYRYEHFESNRAYFSPINHQTKKHFIEQFKQTAQGDIKNDVELMIDHRPLMTSHIGEKKAVCVDFGTICRVPHNQRDYLWLAEHYPAVYIENVRAIQRHEHDLICNFIALVDVLYDQGTQLVILSEVPINQLYVAGPHLTEFERTQSRLIEMQTLTYSGQK